MTPDDANRIVRESFRPRGLVRRLRAATSRWIAPLVGDDVDASTPWNGLSGYLDDTFGVQWQYKY